MTAKQRKYYIFRSEDLARRHYERLLSNGPRVYVPGSKRTFHKIVLQGSTIITRHLLCRRCLEPIGGFGLRSFCPVCQERPPGSRGYHGHILKGPWPSKRSGDSFIPYSHLSEEERDIKRARKRAASKTSEFRRKRRATRNGDGIGIYDGSLNKVLDLPGDPIELDPELDPWAEILGLFTAATLVPRPPTPWRLDFQDYLLMLFETDTPITPRGSVEILEEGGPYIAGPPLAPAEEVTP